MSIGELQLIQRCFGDVNAVNYIFLDESSFIKVRYQFQNEYREMSVHPGTFG